MAGNERADVLAGEAVVGEPIALDPPTVMAAITEWFDNNCVVAPSHVTFAAQQGGSATSC